MNLEAMFDVMVWERAEVVVMVMVVGEPYRAVADNDKAR